MLLYVLPIDDRSSQTIDYSLIGLMVLFLFWEPNVYNKAIISENYNWKGHKGVIFLMVYNQLTYFFLWLKKKSKTLKRHNSITGQMIFHFLQKPVFVVIWEKLSNCSSIIKTIFQLGQEQTNKIVRIVKDTRLKNSVVFCIVMSTILY